MAKRVKVIDFAPLVAIGKEKGWAERFVATESAFDRDGHDELVFD